MNAFDRSCAPLLAILLLTACVDAPVTGGSGGPSAATLEHSVADGDRWVSCGMPGCQLRAPSDVQIEATASGIRMAFGESDVVVDASRQDVQALAGGVSGWLDAQRRTLALAAHWTGPPAAHGFIVRGLTGTAVQTAVLIDEDPHRVHLTAWENPATGSVLLLRASGSASAWAAAWPSLSRVVSEVRLDADF